MSMVLTFFIIIIDNAVMSEDYSGRRRFFPGTCAINLFMVVIRNIGDDISIKISNIKLTSTTFVT
jgi:hypothetical protein